LLRHGALPFALCRCVFALCLPFSFVCTGQCSWTVDLFLTEFQSRWFSGSVPRD
jgi:hypothetical protein